MLSVHAVHLALQSSFQAHYSIMGCGAGHRRFRAFRAGPVIVCNWPQLEANPMPAPVSVNSAVEGLGQIRFARWSGTTRKGNANANSERNSSPDISQPGAILDRP